MGHNQKQIFVIFSVDTEHDIISLYNTKTAGWTVGIPALCDIFDSAGTRGKVCWLIEYNQKEGIVANNSSSDFFVKEFQDFVSRIKIRGDELGIHPTMYKWLGGEKPISVNEYKNPQLWDFNISYNNAEFVMDIITAAVNEFRTITGVNPAGCRTAHFHYATHLAAALEKNGIGVDCSVKNEQAISVKSPNIYFANESDIRLKSNLKKGVLEIPTVTCIGFNPLKLIDKVRMEYIFRLKKPIFLSFYIHNWTAIAKDGSRNDQFLKNLAAFLSLLRHRGACFLSWGEAKDMLLSLNHIYEIEK